MLVNLQAAFGAWSGGAVVPPLKEKPSPLRGRQVVVVDKQDVTQTQIVIGNTGVDINHPDYVPLLVANTVFGSGFTSRLVEELRVKRSLTYGASSGFPASLAGGTFVIQTFTKNETAAEAIDVILGEITRFREEGPSEEEVKKAQNYMAGNFARSLQTPEALATRLTDIEVYGFPKNHLETYLERVRSVGLNDIHRVVREHIRVDDLLFVLVAPASETSGEVERFGRVATISLDEAVK
jgi:zinc protease